MTLLDRAQLVALRKSRLGRQGVVLCAVVVLVGFTVGVSADGRITLASGSAGQVSGTGSIVVSTPVGPNPTDTVTLTVINATNDGAGSVSGTFSGSAGTGFTISGQVTCLVVTGNSVVVGGSGTSSLGYQDVVFFITDNGATGDTLSLNQPVMSSLPGHANCADVRQNLPTALDAGDYTVTSAPNTPASATPGSPVSVTPVVAADGTMPVTLTFSNVTVAGTTTVTTSPTAPGPLPGGYQIGIPATYYDLNTSASHDGDIRVCFSYLGASVAPPAALLHYDTTLSIPAWVEIQDAPANPADTLANRICGTTQSLSPFALVTEAAALRVSGNLLVNAAGEPVHLIGVNRSGSEYMCIQGRGFFEGPSDAASVQAIADWHTNAVRVPLNEDCWLGINGAPPAYSGANYQQAIADYLGLLESHGLTPILELHWSSAGTALATGQEPMPNRDHSITFWTQVASRFMGDGNVVFDLFNEPFPDDNQDSPAAWQCWRDGGTCPGVSFQAAGMQELVTAVRSTGATNVILLGGVRYANALSQWLAYKPLDPTGNLAASWHAYNFNACATVGCWDAEVLPVLISAPVVATEIGEDDCGNGFIEPLMQWLDGHGSGYLPWAWDNNFGCFSLVTDNAGTPTRPYGVAFRDHLATLRTLGNESVLVFGAFQVGPGSTCNPDGSGTINFSAAGASTGTFPGSLTQTGTVTLGPTPSQQGGITFYAPVTAFSSTFTIEAGSTTITGTETLGTPEDTLPFGSFDLVNVGECLGGTFTTNQFGIGLRYSTTITSPDGVFTDTGFGHAFGAENRSISPRNLFEEELASLSGASAPDVPMNVTAAAGDARASLSWAAPASEGGSPITGYQVSVSDGRVLTFAATATGGTVTGLTNDTTYTFTVAATNATGVGAAAASSPVIPRAGAQGATSTVPPGGGSTTTDPGGGPTAADPLTTSVTVPAGTGGGSLAITEGPASGSPPVGYALLGQQVEIQSTAGTSSMNPLLIVFTVDESAIRSAYGLGPSDSLPPASSVDVTRAEGTGVPTVVPGCTSTGGGGIAIAPDPCVASRVYVNGGTDLRVSVLTGSASRWSAVIKIHQPQLITFDQPATHTYGDAPFSLTAASRSGLPITFGAAGACTVAGSQVTITSAGPCAITAIQLGNIAYAAAAPVVRTFTILRRPVTVTATNATAIVGSFVPNLSATVSGAVAGDILGTLTCTSTAPRILGILSAVGGYPIACAGYTNPKYLYSYVPATLSVVYRATGFASPSAGSKWKLGATVSVKFALTIAIGLQISDAAAMALIANPCRVMFSATGPVTVGPSCVKYDSKNHVFVYDWRIPGKTTGTETLTITVTYPNTPVTTTFAEPIVMTK